MNQHDDITGKHVTIVPATDSLSSDYRGKTGTVIGGMGRQVYPVASIDPATGPFVMVQIEGMGAPKKMHRAHLIVTPTPGTIEIDPAMLFARLVDAAFAASAVSVLSTGTRQYREGQYDALYTLYCDLFGQTDTELAAAVAEAMAERVANSD